MPLTIGAVEGTQKDVTLQIMDKFCPGAVRGKQRRCQQKIREDRISEDRYRRPQGKAIATQETPAQREERNIPQQDHQPDWPAGKVIDQLRNSAHAT